MSNVQFEQFTMPHSDTVTDEDDLSDDAAQVLEIIGQIQSTSENQNSSASALSRTIRLLEKFDDQTCIVARDEDGDICAAANMRFDHASEQLWVEHLAVDPEYAGQGISKQFVEYLVGLARQSQLRRIGSRSVTSAIQAHYSWGFTEREGDEEAEEPVMYRDL